MRGEKIGAAYAAHGEKLRFLIVGAWNSLFAYALFAVLLWVAEPMMRPLVASPSAAGQWAGEHYYLTVQWMAWALGVPQSTLAFKYIVFHSRGHLAGEVARAYLVYVPLQVLSFGILWVCSGLLGLHPLVGQLIVMTVNAVLSYFGHRYFTFGQVRASEESGTVL